MPRPGSYTESAMYVAYLREQLDALHNAAHGLTDEQARRTPTTSALSIGGLLKHATYVCDSWFRRERQQRGELSWELDPESAADFYGSFALTAEETLDGVLAAYDDAAARYLAAVAATDPDAPMTEAPAPWVGRHEPTPSVARFAILHGVEELARHAGHADIIREQIDGAQALSLAMAVDGAPGNDFVQPWQPAPA